MGFKFENLKIWNIALELAGEVSVLAKQRGFLNQEIFDEKYAKYEKLIAMIQALIKKIS